MKRLTAQTQARHKALAAFAGYHGVDSKAALAAGADLATLRLQPEPVQRVIKAFTYRLMHVTATYCEELRKLDRDFKQGDYEWSHSVMTDTLPWGELPPKADFPAPYQIEALLQRIEAGQESEFLKPIPASGSVIQQVTTPVVPQPIKPQLAAAKPARIVLCS